MGRNSWLLAVGAVVVSVAAAAGCSSPKSSHAAATTSTVSAATTSTVATPSTTTSGVTANSAYCNLARQVATSLELALPNDPHAALAQFDSLAPQLLTLAPPAIKSDLQGAIDALRQVEPALKAAGDNPDKLTSAQLAPVETPAFTDEINAINAYDLDACGISPPTT